MTQPKAQQNTSSIHMLTSVGVFVASSHGNSPRFRGIGLPMRLVARLSVSSSRRAMLLPRCSWAGARGFKIGMRIHVSRQRASVRPDWRWRWRLLPTAARRPTFVPSCFGRSPGPDRATAPLRGSTKPRGAAPASAAASSKSRSPSTLERINAAQQLSKSSGCKCRSWYQWAARMVKPTCLPAADRIEAGFDLLVTAIARPRPVARVAAANTDTAIGQRIEQAIVPGLDAGSRQRGGRQHATPGSARCGSSCPSKHARQHRPQWRQSARGRLSGRCIGTTPSVRGSRFGRLGEQSRPRSAASRQGGLNAPWIGKRCWQPLRARSLAT